MSGEFDSVAALDIARQLSFPRRVGSAGETQAVEMIDGQLRQAGYKVERQKFRFVMASDLLLRRLIGAGLVLAALGWGASRFQPTLALWPGLLIVLLPLLYATIEGRVRASSVRVEQAENQGNPLRVWPGSQRGALVYSSCNLVASLPTEADEANLPHLILMAHYDSKSQNMPLPVRMGLFAVLLAAAQVFGVVSLLSVAWPGLAGWLPLLAGLVWLAGVPLLFLKSENESPGALDNASGAGLALHLAQVLAHNPALRSQLRWTILITGAEELGLMGAQAFVKETGPVLQQEAEAGHLWVLNFDGIGVDGKLAWVGPRPEASVLSDAVHTAARQAGGEIRQAPKIGAAYDHMVFSELGVEAGTLAGIGRDSLSIHTRADQAALLHSSGFEQAGQTALRSIELLVERWKSLAQS